MDPSGSTTASVGTAHRVQFTPAIDRELLSYVRRANPFSDHRKWIRIATKMREFSNQPFTNRNVRERTYLLLGRYVGKDRAPKDRVARDRRYRTAEDYIRREVLLKEVLSLAQETGAKIPAPRRAISTTSRQAAMVSDDPTTEAAQNLAALARDALPSSTYQEALLTSTVSTDAEDSATRFFGHLVKVEDRGSDDNEVSTVTVEEVNEQPPLIAELTSIPFACSSQAASLSQTGDTTTASDHLEATPSTSHAAAQNDTTPAKGRDERDVNYEFLEKRMRHDLLIKEKEFALESRRLALEEERLAWEKERTVNEGRLVALLDDTRRQLAEQWAEERRLRAEEREKERKERAEERTLAAAQQESLTRIIEKLLSMINSPNGKGGRDDCVATATASHVFRPASFTSRLDLATTRDKPRPPRDIRDRDTTVVHMTLFSHEDCRCYAAAAGKTSSMARLKRVRFAASAAAMSIQARLTADSAIALVQRYLGKERLHWRPSTYASQGEEITSVQRTHTVKWLTVLNRYLKFNPETLFLSVTLMDEFLRLVRAQPKYLKCIAISCFYLASKIIEEDEVSVGNKCGHFASFDVLATIALNCSRGVDVKWDLCRATSLDFLHGFYALLVLNRSLLLPDQSEEQLAALGPLLETKLQICLDQASLVATRPSTLALALVSLELETWTPNWFVITIALQRLAQVENGDVIRCREELACIFAKARTTVSRKHRHSDSQNAHKPSKRRMETTDIEDIYDSIKRLYGEDTASTSPPAGSVSCGMHQVQGGISVPGFPVRAM
ncbi:hypothetical protein HPB50_005743 [Hyalomma asiaticum]|uniref:Uncharacterized protein n=1 Tax=Hyalomma asiaticum TaxID=266040 RepID=A0ACB7SND8_HYAAI|nr:hypothetical protein HPB50_005743 [Hyalomma asiaticum]